MNLYKNYVFVVVLLLVLLSAGISFYTHIEGWSYLDSAYFTVATVTTIGYGDLVPQTDAGKIFTIFFSFVGIGIAFYFITSFTKYIHKKTVKDELKKHHDKLIKSGKLKVDKKR